MSFDLLLERRGLRVLATVLTVVSTGSLGAPSALGQHPLCEASAAVIVACPDGRGQCLLVGDNEWRRSLFLFKIDKGQVQAESQDEVTLNLTENTELSDIEAMTVLPDGRVAVFGSHSRKTNCEAKKNRRRFGIIANLDLASTDLSIVATKRIGCDRIFGSDAKADSLVQAVCKEIDAVESRADVIEKGVEDETLDSAAAKGQCNEVLPFNAEGVVNLASTGDPDIWVGLRAPLLTEHPGDPDRKDLAILLHMKDMKSYGFDGVALLDMGGRGVRNLSLADGWVWMIAGPPQDLADGDTVPFELRRFPADALASSDVIEPELIDADLPTSSEGLVILDGQAIVVIDGDDGGDGATQCAKSSGLISRPLPKP